MSERYQIRNRYDLRVWRDDLGPELRMGKAKNGKRGKLEVMNLIIEGLESLVDFATRKEISEQKREKMRAAKVLQSDNWAI